MKQYIYNIKQNILCWIFKHSHINALFYSIGFEVRQSLVITSITHVRSIERVQDGLSVNAEGDSTIEYFIQRR